MKRPAMYWLRKLGVVRSGKVAGTYRSTKDMPDELFFDNVYDPQADLLHRSDLDALRRRAGTDADTPSQSDEPPPSGPGKDGE